MKTLFAVVLLLSFAHASYAAKETILNWATLDLPEADAVRAVKSAVRSVIEEENNCQLEDIFGLQAINNLKGSNGEQVVVVMSTAQADGIRCELEKYQDCSTSFYKVNGTWKYETTTCEKEEASN